MFGGITLGSAPIHPVFSRPTKSYLPTNISVFSIPRRGNVRRSRGVLLQVVHGHVPVGEAGCQHMGVLRMDVDRHDAALSVAKIFLERSQSEPFRRSDKREHYVPDMKDS